MKRGDIVLIAFPFSDLASQKVRPAVVLSEPSGSEDDIIVSLISSNISRRLTEGDYLLTTENPEFSKTGLKVPSLFRMSKIHNLSKRLAGCTHNIAN